MLSVKKDVKYMTGKEGGGCSINLFFRALKGKEYFRALRRSFDSLDPRARGANKPISSFHLQKAKRPETPSSGPDL
jgi:hypothetical protein